MKKYNLTINGTKYSVDINEIEDNKANIEVNGTSYTVELDMESVPTMQKSQPKVVRVAAPTPKPAPAAPTAVPTAAPAASAGCVVKSPLPGTILDIFVNVGDSVKAGQRIVLLEAMKMENNIDADRDGVVKEIRVRRSDSVMEGDVLLVIE